MVRTNAGLARATFHFRRLRRSVERSPLRVPIAYIVAGFVLALAMLALDAGVGEGDLPSWTHVGPETARSSLIGMVTSFLFVISVVFWVRIWAVQMSARPVLARVLSQFLTDRVQQHAMGFIIGAIAYVVTVVRAVPEQGAGMDAVPHLSVVLAHVLALVIAVLIVFAVHNAARWAQVGHLVRQISEECMSLIRAAHPQVGDAESGERSTAMAVTSQPPTHELHAGRSGWVREIQDDVLLGSLPDGATVRLAVRPGAFILEGATLATVWCQRSDEVDSEEVHSDEVDEEGLRRGIVLDAHPSLDNNLIYGLNELVDIAERALSSSDSDITTAREVVFHLGIVIRELLLHDLPSTVRIDEAGRCLIRRRALEFDGYLQVAFDRLRNAGAHSPELVEPLLEVIGMTVEQLERRNLHDRAELLRAHARSVVNAARERMMLRSDLERVIARADRWSLVDDSAILEGR